MDINFRDMLLGVTIGDAYAAGLELINRDWICNNVQFERYYNERGRLSNSMAINYVPGLYTDDTEMTFGLVKALTNHIKGPQNILTIGVLLDYWKREFDKNSNWFGICRQGHGSIKNYFLGACSIEDVRRGQANRKYPGNAPTMRAVPLGLLKPEYLVPSAIANADATHPHPKARLSSIAVAWAAYYLFIIKGPLIEIIIFVIEKLQDVPVNCLDEEFIQDLKKVDGLPDYNDVPVTNNIKDLDYNLLCGETGFLGADAQRTTLCVLYLTKFYRYNSWELLQNCIKIGGDVDSLASVCLGLIGGRFGLNLGKPDSIPDWVLDSLEGIDEVEQLSTELEVWWSKYERINLI